MNQFRQNLKDANFKTSEELANLVSRNRFKNGLREWSFCQEGVVLILSPDMPFIQQVDWGAWCRDWPGSRCGRLLLQRKLDVLKNRNKKVQLSEAVGVQSLYVQCPGSMLLKPEVLNGDFGIQNEFRVCAEPRCRFGHGIEPAISRYLSRSVVNCEDHFLQLFCVLLNRFALCTWFEFSGTLRVFMV
jgi:hypothetical protein